MTPITTHILDTSIGKPAAGVPVELFRVDDDQPTLVGTAATDSDGRAREIGTGWELASGRYRLRFAIASYFAAQGKPTFYPEVVVDFVVVDPIAHHHIPLLISPFAYSTYRGS